MHLGVNVDHVATLRQARGTDYPDPVEAARLAERAGAAGITVHLRADRRHIQEEDVARLRASVRGKLNLEISTRPEMVEVALARRPHQVTLVPERPEELTTEGGLDLARTGGEVSRAATELGAAGIAVSVFLDPDPGELDRLAELAGSGAGRTVAAFEINTDAYSRSPGEASLAAIRDAAARGRALGFDVHAGHALTVGNVGPIASIPEIGELNIGHAIVSRAVLVGMEEAVREMLAAMAAARG